MSFCRITGKARGLPKPNYFPLLPPISPADAKRFCRITTKSQGLPGHHFIPALLGAKAGKAHCRVTAKSEGQPAHHFPDIEGAIKPHEILPGYKYVFPVFDETQKQQKCLMNLIASKLPPAESNARYVYIVEEKLTGLVIPPELEAAVRDGDVHDVLLDKEGDTMLVKMHKGPNVTLDVSDFVLEENMILWDGLGPSELVLKQRKKEEKDAEARKRKRQDGLSSKKKLFEEKEKEFEQEQLENEKRNEAKKAKMVKVKMRSGSITQEEVVELNGTIGVEETLSTKEDNAPVFGHIVQTATGVEFFPSAAKAELPPGKVVPGRLTRNKDGIRFVPGKMLDGRFMPGQIVMTNNGEQFVPGQVIETREGPKFVPGQVADTKSGPKFVPGQTIETEEGPQFVPGQIIETKAGPTFIPGQIIVTDDGAKFVPGRVVDTKEGPRFVPGRVVESGDQVTFLTGQVVETAEGLRFVAPDLESAPEGGHEFSVQGFEVTPEELRLLPPPMCGRTPSTGEMIIDSRMLRQLSEAGMSVGREVPAELPAVDIRSLPVIFERLKIDDANKAKISQVASSLAQVSMHVSQLNDSCTSNVPVGEDVGSEILKAVQHNEDIGKAIKVLIASAALSIPSEISDSSEDVALAAIGAAIESALGEMVDIMPMDGVVECLHEYLSQPQNLSRISHETVQFLHDSETVVDKLRFVVSGKIEPSLIVQKLTGVLKDNMGEAFLKISSGDPGLLNEVLKRIENVSEGTNEMEATETLQKAIVGAVKEQNEQHLKEMLDTSDSDKNKEFKDLLLQAVGLARAMSLFNVAETLLDVMSDEKSRETLANDPTTLEILERLTLMRRFAEIKPELNTALGQLVSDPEMARTDPAVRELVRQSTALMVVPEEILQSSADIPTSLFMPDNILAMENFLAKTKRPKTLLIIKSRFQCVVPKEASRAVITGQVPYAVLDEKGIRYFEPLHLFSTMRLPQYAAHVFSMYCCPEVEYDSGLVTPAMTPRGSISSIDDFTRRRSRDWTRHSCRNSICDKYSELSDRRNTFNYGYPSSKSLLDRRLSDWASVNLHGGSSATSNDSLLNDTSVAGLTRGGTLSYFASGENSPRSRRRSISSDDCDQVEEERFPRVRARYY